MELNVYEKNEVYNVKEKFCAEIYCNNKARNYGAIKVNGIEVVVCLCDKHGTEYDNVEFKKLKSK